MLFLPACGNAGVPTSHPGPGSGPESPHGTVLAPPGFSACAPPGCRPLRTEESHANLPDGRKGLDDEDEDHTTTRPTAWFADQREEDDLLQEGTSCRQAGSCPDQVRLTKTPAHGKGVPAAGAAIPGILLPRSGAIPRDGPRAEGSDDDPSDDAGHVPFFYPFASSPHGFPYIVKASGPLRDRRIHACCSCGSPDAA